MEYPIVTIGAPVRDRAWILKHYLKALYNLDYPKNRIKLLFLVNDSTDKSLDILKEFKELHKMEYIDISVQVFNQKAKKDERTWKRIDLYQSIANVRNKIIEQIDTDYFFSVDSDILVSPDSLKILIESNKDIVAGVIRNDYIMQPDAEYPNTITNLLIKNEKGNIVHYKGYPLNSLFRVHTTGAVYLLSARACKELRYGFDELGEDIYFCKMAEEKGIEVWANSNVFCQHVMIVHQMVCQDCILPCKAVRVEDNRVHPELRVCPRKRTKKKE